MDLISTCISNVNLKKKMATVCYCIKTIHLYPTLTQNLPLKLAFLLESKVPQILRIGLGQQLKLHSTLLSPPLDNSSYKTLMKTQYIPDTKQMQVTRRHSIHNKP